jgi:hypothetical protein
MSLRVENLASSRAVNPELAAEISAAEPFLRDLWSRLEPPRR